MARRTKEDAEKTREALLDAAERVFLRRGVTPATLNEIAKEAGVTRGAVYWHFEDKIAIFRAMHDRVKQPFDLLFDAVVAGPDPINGLKSLCTEVLVRMGRDEHTRNVFTILRLRSDDLQFGDSDYARDMCQKREQVLGRFTRIFTQAAENGLLAKGVIPGVAALTLHGFISGIMLDYLREPDSFDVVALAPSMVEILFRGIIA